MLRPFSPRLLYLNNLPAMGNESKNRMVSCRLTPEDYERLLELTSINGVRSVSELARLAISALLQHPTRDISISGSLESRVAALEVRLQTLSTHVRHLRDQIFPEPTQAQSSVVGFSHDE